uniref:Endonuclease, Uma2 family (Restriction endonuclease fold) n=1 Tax=uncultured Thiotrichaceae bacterium TaxID=298394 RepID=A0A6S6SBW6_9GAMM|nr:MAG: Endonuclease, Uma2 family (Restriction endonuclease fold) [uncultured Thiotrichaceae bacterium]
MPSLQEYVLVEQDFVEVEVLRRSQSWRSENYYLGQVVPLESVGVELDVAELYERVDNADMIQFRK